VYSSREGGRRTSCEAVRFNSREEERFSRVSQKGGRFTIGDCLRVSLPVLSRLSLSLSEAEDTLIPCVSGGDCTPPWPPSGVEGRSGEAVGVPASPSVDSLAEQSLARCSRELVISTLDPAEGRLSVVPREVTPGSRAVCNLSRTVTSMDSPLPSASSPLGCLSPTAGIAHRTLTTAAKGAPATVQAEAVPEP
jgi:hypothetical protein